MHGELSVLGHGSLVSVIGLQANPLKLRRPTCSSGSTPDPTPTIPCLDAPFLASRALPPQPLQSQPPLPRHSRPSDAKDLVSPSARSTRATRRPRSRPSTPNTGSPSPANPCRPPPAR